MKHAHRLWTFPADDHGDSNTVFGNIVVDFCLSESRQIISIPSLRMSLRAKFRLNLLISPDLLQPSGEVALIYK